MHFIFCMIKSLSTGMSCCFCYLILFFERVWKAEKRNTGKDLEASLGSACDICRACSHVSTLDRISE